MSSETLSKLEKAIQEHTADEGNGDLTAAWALVTGGLSLTSEDDGQVWTEAPMTQPDYVTIGLLEGAQIMLRAGVYAAVMGDDDE